MHGAARPRLESSVADAHENESTPVYQLTSPDQKVNIDVNTELKLKVVFINQIYYGTSDKLYRSRLSFLYYNWSAM